MWIKVGLSLSNHITTLAVVFVMLATANGAAAEASCKQEEAPELFRAMWGEGAYGAR